MGTLHLIIGIVLIGIGLFVTYYGLEYLYYDEPITAGSIIAVLILTVPEYIIGGILVRKFDKDREK